MYQTATRVAAEAPPRPTWRLAGRQVNQAMYYDAEKAKRSGKRVFMVTAGATGQMAVHDDCENCEGFGWFALEVVGGGPYRAAPQGKGDEATGGLRPAHHNGAWWLVARNFYRCPVCNDVREIQL